MWVVSKRRRLVGNDSPLAGSESAEEREKVEKDWRQAVPNEDYEISTRDQPRGRCPRRPLTSLAASKLNSKFGSAEQSA